MKKSQSLNPAIHTECINGGIQRYKRFVIVKYHLTLVINLGAYYEL